MSSVKRTKEVLNTFCVENLEIGSAGPYSCLTVVVGDYV